MRRRSERGTRNCPQSIFRKFILKKTILKILYWQCWSKDECFMTLRIPFCRSVSMFWNIFDRLFTQVFYSSTYGERWLEVICALKSKVIEPQPKYKTRSFQNLIRKRLLRGIHWNQKKTNWNFKVLLGLIKQHYF